MEDEGQSDTLLFENVATAPRPPQRTAPRQTVLPPLQRPPQTATLVTVTNCTTCTASSTPTTSTFTASSSSGSTTSTTLGAAMIATSMRTSTVNDVAVVQGDQCQNHTTRR